MKLCVGRVVLASCILAAQGCKSPLPPYTPVEKRNGRVYCYTRDFVKGSGSQVVFFRQPFEAMFPGGDGQWGFNPFALLLVPVAVPLALCDWFIAAPVIDTGLLPYDIYRNCVQEDATREEECQP